MHARSISAVLGISLVLGLGCEEMDAAAERDAGDFDCRQDQDSRASFAAPSTNDASKPCAEELSFPQADLAEASLGVGLSASASHACAWAGGRAYCWGDNRVGQLGNGCDHPRAPASVPLDEAIVQVTVGGGGNGISGHTCALTSEGSVACWGSNAYGQLGIGSTRAHSAPQWVHSLGDVEAVGAGLHHTCALRKDGTVWCWGMGHQAALGNGSLADKLTPTRVHGIEDAIELSVGGGHACILTREHRLKCWGPNSHGEIGTGSEYVEMLATPVEYDGETRTVMAGGQSTCAQFDTGPHCWGNNQFAQLGHDPARIGDQARRPVALEIEGELAILAHGGTHSCALLSDGAVQCWGGSRVGQLGQELDEAFTAMPQAIEGLPPIVDLTVGAAVTFARSADDRIWAWGANMTGQAGIPAPEHLFEPTCVFQVVRE